MTVTADELGGTQDIKNSDQLVPFCRNSILHLPIPSFVG
jgi:hypothetical protein